MKNKKIISFALTAALTLSFATSVSPSVFAADDDATSVSEDGVYYHYYIVQLKEDPLSKYDDAKAVGVDDFIFTDEGQKAYEKIIAEQTDFLEKLNNYTDRNVEQVFKYTAAINGVCVRLTEDEYDYVSSHKKKFGYKRIAISKYDYNYQAEDSTTIISAEPKAAELYSAVTPSYDKPLSDATQTILETIGIDDTEYRGENMVVGIIDTEFDLDHEFFTLPKGTDVRLTSDNIENIAPYLSSSKYEDDLYYNKKIPYAFNYGDLSNDTAMKEDGSSHGTHVAGIIAGNGLNTENAGEFTPSGIVPEAQLVLGSAALYGYEIFAALDDMLYIGVDVINCSFGDTGESYNSSELSLIKNDVYTNANNTGVAVCVASGNDSRLMFNESFAAFMPDTSVSGSPSNIKSNFSIAAAQNNYVAKNSLRCGNEYIEFTADNASVEVLGEKEYSFVMIPGIGTEDDFDNAESVEGKIAVVNRGNLFSDTSQIAFNRGAVGVLIIDYASSTALNTIPDNGGILPIAIISYEDSLLLENNLDEKIVINGFYYLDTVSNGGRTTDFSSWGPTSDLRFDSDIMAFGGSIVSSVAIYGKENKYDIFSGTSMACPQMCGIVASLKQYLMANQEQYDIENEGDYYRLIKKLLMSTSVPVAYDIANVTASPRVQGSGLVNLTAATETPAYLYTDSSDDQYLPKVSLGDDPEKSGQYQFNCYVKNISEEDLTYELGYDLMGEYFDQQQISKNDRILTDSSIVFTDADGAEIESITVKANSFRKITALINIAEIDQDYIDDNFKNGSFIEGYIYLTNNENPQLSLPFIGFYGDWTYDGNQMAPYLYSGEETQFQDLYSYITDLNDSYIGENYYAYYDIYYGGSAIYPIVAFSPNGDGYADEILSVIYGVRAADDLVTSIYNANGDVVFTFDSEYLLNSAASDSRAADSGNITDYWDGTDVDGKIHEGEIYTVVSTSELYYKNRVATDEISCQVVIDVTAPEIIETEVVEFLGSTYLRIVASDNTYINGAAVYTSSNMEEAQIYNLVAVDNEFGEATEMLVEITGLSGEIYFEVEDCAGNYSSATINADIAA